MKDIHELSQNSVDDILVSINNPNVFVNLLHKTVEEEQQKLLEYLYKSPIAKFKFADELLTFTSNKPSESLHELQMGIAAFHKRILISRNLPPIRFWDNFDTFIKGVSPTAELDASEVKILIWSYLSSLTTSPDSKSKLIQLLSSFKANSQGLKQKLAPSELIAISDLMFEGSIKQPIVLNKNITFARNEVFGFAYIVLSGEIELNRAFFDSLEREINSLNLNTDTLISIVTLEAQRRNSLEQWAFDKNYAYRDNLIMGSPALNNFTISFIKSYTPQQINGKSFVGGIIDVSHPVLCGLWPHVYSEYANQYVPLLFLANLNAQDKELLVFFGDEKEHLETFEPKGEGSAVLTLDSIPEWVKMLPLKDTTNLHWSHRKVPFEKVEKYDTKYFLSPNFDYKIEYIIANSYSEISDFDFYEGNDVIIIISNDKYYVITTDKEGF